MHSLAAIALAAALVGGCSRTSSQVADAAIDVPIDVPVDMRPDPCLACGPGELCVASYDGTCIGYVGCVARTTDCPDNRCSAACESAYCRSPYQCQERPPCGGEPPGAFTCYGP
jgi:hypothetical protein